MGFFQVSAAASRRERIRSRLPREHPRHLDLVATAIAGLDAPSSLSIDELAGSLTVTARLRNQLDAYLTELAGAADTAKASQVLRAGTTGTLVAAATGCTPAAGSAVVAAARALRHHPHVEAAYRSGSISSTHVTVITRAGATLPGFAALESAVVACASATDPVEVRRVLEVITDQIAPGKPDLDAAAQRARRGLYLSARPSGMWRISGLLDDTTGSKLADLIASFTAPADTLDNTTPAQRRADALDTLADAAAANTRPLGVSAVSVLVDVDRLPDGATLEDGTLLTRAQYDLLACAAVVSIILGTRRSGTFVPLALGRSRRRASAAQWAALTARDRGCIGCGRPPRFCHAHHIIGWAAGGLTDLDNLCLLCPRCHADLHHGRYSITMTAGLPTITPTKPPGRRR